MRFPNFFGLLLFNKPITILPALLAIAFAFIATMVLSPIYEPIIILVTLPLLGAFLIWYLSFLAYFYLLRQDKNLILRGINLYTFQKPVQKAFIVHAVLLGPAALIGWYFNPLYGPPGMISALLVFALTILFCAAMRKYVQLKMETEMIRKTTDFNDMNALYQELRQLLLRAIESPELGS